MPSLRERRVTCDAMVCPKWVEVLELQALGLSRSEVGTELGIAKDTVRGHLRMVGLSGFPSKMHAIAEVIEQGLLDRAELEKKCLVGRYAFLEGISKETVDYLKDKDNWGKSQAEMAADHMLTLRGFKDRLARLYRALGFTKFTQLQVFAYLAGSRIEDPPSARSY